MQPVQEPAQLHHVFRFWRVETEFGQESGQPAEPVILWVPISCDLVAWPS